MTIYTDDNMLLLSGIQHYRYCPRQWALIHLEQEWEDNSLTYEGQLLHKNVDNPFYRQRNGSIITLRAINVASYTLGLYGIMDALELHPASTDDINTISHPRYPGAWLPFPIEYKHGKPKENYIDEIQLAAQTICIEEMYGIAIDRGAIYYDRIKHRQDVIFTPQLREEVYISSAEMHRIFVAQQLPPPDNCKKCFNCSLKELCNPTFATLQDPLFYLKRQLYEETT